MSVEDCNDVDGFILKEIAYDIGKPFDESQPCRLMSNGVKFGCSLNPHKNFINAFEKLDPQAWTSVIISLRRLL